MDFCAEADGNDLEKRTHIPYKLVMVCTGVWFFCVLILRIDAITFYTICSYMAGIVSESPLEYLVCSVKFNSSSSFSFAFLILHHKIS